MGALFKKRVLIFKLEPCRHRPSALRTPFYSGPRCPDFAPSELGVAGTSGVGSKRFWGVSGVVLKAAGSLGHASAVRAHTVLTKTPAPQLIASATPWAAARAAGHRLRKQTTLQHQQRSRRRNATGWRRLLGKSARPHARQSGRQRHQGSGMQTTNSSTTRMQTVHRRPADVANRRRKQAVGSELNRTRSTAAQRSKRLPDGTAVAPREG